VTADKLTTWDVAGDNGEDPPISEQNGSGASDPDGDFNNIVRTAIP